MVKRDFKSELILADLPERDLQLLMVRELEQVYKKGEILFKEDANKGSDGDAPKAHRGRLNKISSSGFIFSHGGNRVLGDYNSLPPSRFARKFLLRLFELSPDRVINRFG